MAEPWARILTNEPWIYVAIHKQLPLAKTEFIEDFLFPHKLTHTHTHCIQTENINITALPPWPWEYLGSWPAAQIWLPIRPIKQKNMQCVIPSSTILCFLFWSSNLQLQTNLSCHSFSGFPSLHSTLGRHTPIETLKSKAHPDCWPAINLDNPNLPVFCYQVRLRDLS